MYLKSIVLKGFKSFPDRTKLEFGPGVSVIVGPNGSGKSNITDAVLWALGEQSPLAVRGQSMQDVIFGGAPGRQGARGAEVELVLDDSEGMLGLGAPEVSIVRRLDRGGEGEYRLAGARCRLVDVIEVLSDTGLGKEMHSVISQGRVESIVTSKPRDRRMLIEEAAGLGKHRKRRRRAQLKLARTQDNLDRALDVEREARSRLRPLKRQAEAAELHARLERQTLEARWELGRDDLRRHQAELAAAQDAAAQARAEREQVERELTEVAGRREAAEEALARRSAHREELSRRCFLAQSAGDRVVLPRRGGARGASGTSRAACAAAASISRGCATPRRPTSPDPRDRRADRRARAGARPARPRPRGRARAPARRARGTAARRRRGRRRAGADRRAARGSRASRPASGSSRRAAELREAERAVEAARREAARVGGELAACNQFLRSQTAAPGGATVLADQLEVDPGYELAVAAALDGRLRAAVLARPGSRRRAARSRRRRRRPCARRAVRRPAPGAGEPPSLRRTTEPSRSPATSTARRRRRRSRGRCSHDVWVVESLERLPDRFDGVAVTLSGRVWSSRTRELRQAPAVGEERVLAERNRRDALVRASEAAVQAEHAAGAALERHGEAVARADAESEQAIAAHRAAVSQRDEAGEEERRIAAAIERRRAAPDDGPDAGRRMQVSAELARGPGRARARAARARRAAGADRAAAATRRCATRRCCPQSARVIEALEHVASAIAERREQFELALRSDREAGEHVAAELKECAQREAALHAQLRQGNERLTECQVRLQRVRDRVDESDAGAAASSPAGWSSPPSRPPPSSPPTSARR